MKYSIFTIFPIAFLWFSFACSEKSSSGSIQIVSDPSEELLDIKSLFEGSELITIRLPDSVLIGNIFSSKAVGDLIYIHDNFNNCLFIIDSEKQKLEGIINAHGEGPKEYSQINSFDLDNKGNSYIYDFGRKILSFSGETFNYELKDINLQIRDFNKSKNGYILVNPHESYLNNQSTIIEIDSNGLVLKQIGDEPDSKTFIPNTFFQKFSSKIYINDNSSQSIKIYDQMNGSIKSINFKISGEDRSNLVDFWVANEENMFTIFPARNDSIILFSQIQDFKFLKNLKGVFSSFDFLPVNKFPYQELENKYDYLIYNSEEVENLLKYYQSFSEAESFIEENGNYYLREDKNFLIPREKIQRLISQLELAKNSNSILVRKFIKQ
jgi:hypothetical protein